MNMNLTSLSLLLLQLRWKQVTIVTDDQKDAESLIYMSDTKGLQRAHVSGREALSGEWVYDVVKTGRDSWSPVYILMTCSATCMNAALTQATLRERKLGTKTAFGMMSRWLLVSTGSGYWINHLIVVNTTMDNVAVVETCPSTQRCYRNLVIHTLQWTQGQTRKWTLAERLNQEFHHTAYDETTHWDQLLFPNSRLGFNGRQIRVLVKEWDSYLKVTIKNGSKLWSGLLMDFLNVARDHLNFTYDLVDATEDEWGTGTPGDADRGFLGHVVRGEVDIGLANYGTTWERSLLLDTLWPLIISPFVMVYRKRDAEEYNMPLGPLGSVAAIYLTVALTLVSLLLWLLEIVWRSNCVERNGHGLDAPSVTCWKKLLKLDKVLQIAGAALFSEPSQRRLRSRGGRTLLWSWWMLVLVVTAAYSGTLTSFLSVSKQSELFSTPEDLLTNGHGYTWSSLNDNDLTIIFKNSSLPVYRGLWSGIQQTMAQDPAIADYNITALVEKVRTENFVLFISQLTAVSMFGKDCNIVMRDMGIKPILMSPKLPKGSALLHPLSDIVHRLHADGVLSQWIDKWFPRTSCPRAQGPVVISLLHVKGVLLVLPVGLVLAVLVIMLEIAYFRKRKANQHHHCADTITR